MRLFDRGEIGGKEVITEEVFPIHGWHGNSLGFSMHLMNTFFSLASFSSFFFGHTTEFIQGGNTKEVCRRSFLPLSFLSSFLLRSHCFPLKKKANTILVNVVVGDSTHSSSRGPSSSSSSSSSSSLKAGGWMHGKYFQSEYLTCTTSTSIIGKASEKPNDCSKFLIKQSRPEKKGNRSVSMPP